MWLPNYNRRCCGCHWCGHLCYPRLRYHKLTFALAWVSATRDPPDLSDESNGGSLGAQDATETAPRASLARCSGEVALTLKPSPQLLVRYSRDDASSVHARDSTLERRKNGAMNEEKPKAKEE